MDKHNVLAFQGRETGADPLTELLRTGAQELVRRAVETELTEVLAQYADRRRADGTAGLEKDRWVYVWADGVVRHEAL